MLIVEDNRDAAEMLELVVSQLGHVTKVAHDGATAITIATQFAPDVVLLDIGLPVMNGYAVVRALRERPEFTNVHIAAVTGWGQEEDRRKAREAGFDSHFTKPLSPEALHDLLATIAPHAVGARRGEHATRPASLILSVLWRTVRGQPSGFPFRVRWGAWVSSLADACDGCPARTHKRA